MQNFFSRINKSQTLQALDEQGFASIPNFLPVSLCEDFIRHYTDNSRYRSTINMASHNFGEGQYRYFSYPLPDPLNDLRRQSYDYLLPLARKWASASRLETQYPDEYAEYLQQCHLAGQRKPTPLILKYQQNGYNCLHQDLYGDWVFPFQLIVLLSKPQRDFEGGELVLSDQRPRMQSRAHVLTPDQSDAVILAVHHRPQRGTRGYYRINMRHGVSTIRRGTRYTLGIILHDAK